MTLYDNKIAEQEAELETNLRGLEALKELKRRASKEKGLNQWVSYPFESSSMLTPEFAKFSREFRSYVKKSLAEKGLELVNFNRGHFYVSGFIKNSRTEKMAYFSTSDVRFFPNAWNENMLVRTAENDKDYTGGSNAFCKLVELAERAESLTA